MDIGRSLKDLINSFGREGFGMDVAKDRLVPDINRCAVFTGGDRGALQIL
jgi:hypothetical protein